MTNSPALSPGAGAPGPLAGLKVLELGQLIAGPFAAKTLADFGADVLKVEAPGAGDPLRKWRLLKDGTSVWWQVQSRGKRSVALDLRQPEAQEIVRRLALDADVLIENFRPGAMEGWGLGPDQLLELNPRLVMLRISGYGQSGPYRDRPGFGVVAEAMGGLRHLTAEPGRVPVRVGVSMGDTLAALHGVIGILLALHERQRSGQGQVIDVALYEAVFNCMESLLPEYSAFGAVRGAAGSALPGIAPSNAYRCRDEPLVAAPAEGRAPAASAGPSQARPAPPGDSEPREAGSAGASYVLIAGNGDSIFRRLMGVIGRPDLGADPALADNAGRVAQVDKIDAAIGQWTATRSVDAVLAALDAAGVPAGRIYTVADIAADLHYRARGMLQEVRMDDGSVLTVPGIVPKLSRTPGGMGRNAPQVGQDTDAVLREMGLSPAQIQTLRARGIVAGAPA